MELLFWNSEASIANGASSAGSSGIVRVLSLEPCYNPHRLDAAASRVDDFMLLVLPRLHVLRRPLTALREVAVAVAGAVNSSPGQGVATPEQVLNAVRHAASNLRWWADRSVELLCALQYMHGVDVAHGDLKPSNVLFDRSTGSLVVSDVGLAQLHASTKWVSQGTGTRNWVPPEIQTGDGGRPKPVDVFGAGSVLFQLFRHVIGQLPFKDTIYLSRAYTPADVRDCFQHYRTAIFR